jgi:site-specific DNA recombinase
MSTSSVPHTAAPRQSSRQTQPVAAVYARVSTADQADRGYSLPTQIAACQGLAQQKGYTVPDTHIFVDDYPGASLNRPQLTRLRDLVRQRLVRALFVYDLDRLSRKLAHQLLLIEEAEDAGVALRIVTTPDEAKTPESQLLAHVRGSIAEYERAKLLERTARGRRGRVQAGNVPSGRRTFGYVYAPATPEQRAHYEVHPDEAEVVRRIFRLYTQEGVSRDRIAALLTAERVPTRTDWRRTLPVCVWHPSTIGVILQNEAYIGTLYDGKTQNVPGKRNPDKKTRHRAVPREEWIAVAVPPLIDRATFEAAQDIRARNKRESKRNRKHPYLLINGRLRCGQCGCAMAGRTNQRGYAVYRCTRAKHLDVVTPHSRRSVQATAIESDIWGHVYMVVSDPSMIIAEFKRRQDGIGAKQADLDHERQSYERQLTQCDRDLKRWEAAYLGEAIDLADFKQKKAEVDARRASAAQELVRLDAEHARIRQAELNIVSLKAFLAGEQQKLDHATVTEKRQALETLGVQVTWHPETGSSITFAFGLPVAYTTPLWKEVIGTPWDFVSNSSWVRGETLANTPKCTDVHQLISA